MTKVIVEIDYVLYTGDNFDEVTTVLSALNGDTAFKWQAERNSYNANLTVHPVSRFPSARFVYPMPLFLPVGSVVVVPAGGSTPLIMSRSDFSRNYPLLATEG